MTTDALAHYYFLPYYREGFATLIKNEIVGMRAQVDIEITATGTKDGGKDTEPIGDKIQIQLYGPGDIVGFGESVIARRIPERHVGDFEPNYFPFLDFAQPDFPWRFTPEAPQGEQLKPWITLIALKAEEEKEFEEVQPGSYPEARSPCITITKDGVLPKLEESWRWAHVQVTTDERLTDVNKLEDLKKILCTEPRRVVARLLCARKLEPNKLYHIFVVPTFKLGVHAGLGNKLEVLKANELAWDPKEVNQLVLPYYYRWEFRTGDGGDFEALVRRLEPRKLTGLGIREVDCANPGYGLTGVVRTDDAGRQVSTLGLEGALKSLDTKYSAWGHDLPGWSPSSPVDPFQSELASLINQPKAAGTDTPLVVPSIYGRWHAAKDSVQPDRATWLDQLNLDPRHRIAAALGTLVVQKQQEQLMAAAWAQIGAVDAANEILRRAQLGREASFRIWEQRLQKLPTGNLIRLTSPVHPRVLMTRVPGNPSQPESIRQIFRQSRIPLAALDPALRRIGRRRGPVRKRQQWQAKKEYRDPLERLNDGTLRAAGPHPEPDGALRMCEITFGLLKREGLTKVPEKLCLGAMQQDRQQMARELGLFCEVNISCDLIKTTPGRPDFVGGESGVNPKLAAQGDDSDEARDFRKLLTEVCQILEQPPEEPEPDPLDLQAIRDVLLEKLDPRQTIVARTRARLKLKDIPEQADPLDQIMAAPEFDTPMYQSLAEISQDFILPGMETVPQNTLAILETSRFLFGYFVGLNHEMARELLWREYPTDQRGTYFRQFWEKKDFIPSPEQEQLKDIRPIHEWGDNLLDNLAVRTPADESRIVLLIRGDLLRRYPNTLIYAAKGVYHEGKRIPALPEHYEDSLSEDPDNIRWPIFSGKLPPDVTFLGFNLTHGVMCSDPGWFFVIEERVSETRFGIDLTAAPNFNTWDDLSWANFKDVKDGVYLDGRSPDKGPADMPDADLPDKAIKWGDSSANIAWITLQKPFRIAVHASRVIPKFVTSPEE